jgi:hypothetical protein
MLLLPLLLPLRRRLLLVLLLLLMTCALAFWGLSCRAVLERGGRAVGQDTW